MLRTIIRLLEHSLCLFLGIDLKFIVGENLYMKHGYESCQNKCLKTVQFRLNVIAIECLASIARSITMCRLWITLLIPPPSLNNYYYIIVIIHINYLNLS